MRHLIVDSNIPVQTAPTVTPKIENPIVKPIPSTLKTPSNRTKYILIAVLTLLLFITFVVGGAYYLEAVKQQSDSISGLKPTPKINPIVSGKNLLVYNLDEEIENKVKVKNTYIYDLNTTEKKLFNSKNAEMSLPTSIKNVIFSQSFENEILFLSDKNENIVSSSYNKKTKEISELTIIPKSQILGISDWRDFSFSPDKTKLVYATFGMGTPANIYLLDFTKKQSQQITSDYSDTSPMWLNENRIIFQRRDGLSDAIWVADVLSGKMELLLGSDQGINANNSFRYAFTSDGKKIIFPSHLNGQGQDISILDISSKQISKLFHIPYQDFTYAQITKDSNYLVWGSLLTGEYGSRSIFSYNLVNAKQNTICVSNARNWCGDFHLLKQ